MDPIQIDDDGFLDFDVLTAEGQKVVRLDVLLAHNRFAELTTQHADETERGHAWCQWLHGQGFPVISHVAALRVVNVLISKVGEWNPPTEKPAGDA